jgi:hypothetical protein
MCTYFIGLLRRAPNGSLGDHAMIHLASLKRWSEPGAMLQEGDA